MIPARLESSRLPKKALKELHGYPMIVHVALRAKLAKKLDDVIVCTDSPEIAEACFDRKIEVCITSSDCVNGTERIAEASRLLGGGSVATNYFKNTKTLYGTRNAERNKRTFTFVKTKVTLYQRADNGSPSWYFKIRLKGERQYYKRSLKTTSFTEAKELAEEKIV